MENYWHYIRHDSDTLDYPKFRHYFLNTTDFSAFERTNMVVIATQSGNVYLGYCIRKENEYTWYDQLGCRIENVAKWNYLPQDSPIDDLSK